MFQIQMEISTTIWKRFSCTYLLARMCVCVCVYVCVCVCVCVCMPTHVCTHMGMIAFGLYRFFFTSFYS